ncbi:MAG: GNAT family N-acetyltransferase [Rhodospirillales bacterium]
MSISVESLKEHDESDVENFILSQPTGMFYGSLKYRNLLKSFLEAQDMYLVAKNGSGAIVGVLPAFMHASGSSKPVMNSLPFFGSHGGAIADNIDVKRLLVERLHTIAKDNDCTSITIITSPSETNLDVYETGSGGLFRDERIGQISELVEPGVDAHATVMQMIPSKNRNMVRKAQKSGVSVSKDRFPGMFDFLYRVHEANMNDIGGTSKPRHFFELVDEIYDYGDDYQIFTGWVDGTPVAAMLLFYYKSFVEYFTPVILNDYRSFQPLSLLIYQGMVDAAEAGRKYWNWGGTWKQQVGVYRFKKSWGAIDFPYQYFTNVFDTNILNTPKDDILRKYPYFYVLPFADLES